MWGGLFSRQPPSGRLLFSTPKSLLEAGCRLNSPLHKAVFLQTLTHGGSTDAAFSIQTQSAAAPYYRASEQSGDPYRNAKKVSRRDEEE
jgi:hypothetical protein